MATDHPSPRVRFTAFELNLQTGELFKHGRKLRLQTQSFVILASLLEKPGEVLTREELCRKLWPSGVFVDFELGLNAAINRLRSLLSDSPEKPRFIETLPRRGYRFIAPVERDPQKRITPDIASLAVLPLENLTGNVAEEYFVDGMTEALITRLAQVGALRVISRTSVMHYKGTRKKLPEIAKELNVDAIVEGSIARSGSLVRVTAQLIHARSDLHLWAKDYERNMTNILLLQAEVASAIAIEVQVRLTPQESARLASARPVEPEAYQAYLRGRLHWNKRTEEGMTKGLELFQQASDKDASYALSHAGVAECYNMMAFWGMAAPHEVSPKAKAAASKALEIDDSLAEGYTARGWVRLVYDWDWLGAEKELQRAIELNPGYATAHQWYSHLLIYQGRYQEALAEVERTLALDPLSVPMNSSGAYVRILARRFDEAEEKVRSAIELEANFAPSHFFLGRVYEETGRTAEALDAFQKAVAISGEVARFLSGLGHGYAVAGRNAEAQKVLERLVKMAEQRYVSAYDFAAVYAGIGDSEPVFVWLEKAYEERSTWLTLVKADSRFDRFHPDPRFQRLLVRLGLGS